MGASGRICAKMDNMEREQQVNTSEWRFDKKTAEDFASVYGRCKKNDPPLIEGTQIYCVADILENQKQVVEWADNADLALALELDVFNFPSPVK